MCWRKDWKNGLDIESKPEAIKSNSNPPKMLVLKRLLNFSPLSYASRTSVSKSKIHLYYKHFSVEELKTSQFVLNQGEKHRNTCLYSEHFQRRVRANWLVFNRIWVAVYCLLCFSFFVRSRYRCTSSLARKRNSAHFSTAYQRVEICYLSFSTRGMAPLLKEAGFLPAKSLRDSKKRLGYFQAVL